MTTAMESDEINEFKVICKNFFEEADLIVYFDTAVSEEVKWRPHIFAKDDQSLILDILTQDKIASFYIKKYAELRSFIPNLQIYIGLVGDLNYFFEVISKCHQNGLGIYKINESLKLLLESRQPTIEDLEDRGQMAIISGRPYRNILALRKCFRRCRSYIHWFERNLPSKALETLFEAIENGDIHNVETIKLLRGLDDKVENLRKDFLKFRTDIASIEINTELRIICDTGISSSVHGRYLYSRNDEDEPIYFKLPPLNSLKANQWDTILTGSENPSFEELWGSGLDIRENWNEIKPRFDEYCERRARQLENQAQVLRSSREEAELS